VILVVGLGNPGSEYEASRHNLGFRIAEALAESWELPRPRKRFAGLYSEGRAGPGGPRVAVLLPQTFMNDSGGSAGPARGSLKATLDHVVVLHDEIDLPFGEVRVKLGGGVAGHNGLRSLEEGLGSREFWRVRGGVGRPEASDPEIVSKYVLGRFRESPDQVDELVAAAAGEAERLVGRIAAGETGGQGSGQ
jgi:PTH1 family peptidyl-tRNA hydrolase